MSRFSSLEFQNEEENNPLHETAVVKDELYYFQYATKAFLECRFEEGLRYYAKVLEFNPKNISAWTCQVRMLIELGEFPEAKLWADKALEQFPDAPELLAAKAVALARLGDLKAAMAFSDAAISERGETPYIWLARGDVLLARNEERAGYCFTKAAAMAARDWVVQWLASRIYFYYNKFSMALRHAQEAVSLDAGQAAAWLQLGQCQLELGLTGPAANSLEQAKELNPGCQKAHEALSGLRNVGFWGKMRRRIFRT